MLWMIAAVLALFNASFIQANLISNQNLDSIMLDEILRNTVS